MAPLVVPNAVLVRLIWNLGGSPYAVNVIGARKVSATTVDQGFANTLSTAIKTAFTSGFAAAISNQVGLGQVAVRDISTANRPEFVGTGAAAPGTAVGNLLPLQTAVCTTLRTAFAGKSFRGRFYQPGFTVESNAAGGTMAPTVPTGTANWVTAIDTAFQASGLKMAVVSRKLQTATDVTLVQVRDTQWDTIRKRGTPGI